MKLIKKIIIGIACAVIALGLLLSLYMCQAKFGKLPQGDRLAALKVSPNYKKGKFRNKTECPTFSEGYSLAGELYKSLTVKYSRTRPEDSIPSIKTDLKEIPITENVLVWLGHSSFFLQLEGKKFLVDPVFSGCASPIPGSVKAYKGTDIYAAEEMPDIDYLLISHDHYDHLDYETIVKLEPKVGKVICGLGVGAHFEHWGYDNSKLIERDWSEKIEIAKDFTVYTERTHHESGRGLIRGKALWLSFVIWSPSMKIYYSGDGGYDNRFEEIRKKYGSMDWAIMECGQYDRAWESVHNLPEQVVRATNDLKAKKMLPVHHSKFTLANHPWDEPLVKITELSASQTYNLATPLIGEIVYLNNRSQQFKQWWIGIK